MFLEVFGGLFVFSSSDKHGKRVFGFGKGWKFAWASMYDLEIS